MFIEWSSIGKCWKTYNKDTKENVNLPMNVPFILLDQLTTVTGFNEKANKSMYGTEVKDLKDPIKVFLDGNVLGNAPWTELKETVRDIKFAKSVYAMAKIDGEFQLVCFKIAGCALSWFDFVEEVGLPTLEGDAVIAVTSTEEDKKGATAFNRPKFAVVKTELSDEAAKQADEADEALQAYLKDYLNQSDEPESEDGPSDDTSREAEMEDGAMPPPFDPADEVIDDDPF